MRLYRILLKPKSSVISPLQSDTVFGAFAWSYKYIYGEEKLEELLGEYKRGNPRYIFSDCYPEDYFPRPLKLREWEHDTYDKFKKNKRITLVHINDFNKLINNIKFEDYMPASKRKYSNETMHSSIDRNTGHTGSSEEQGGLYSVYEDTYDDNLAIYVKCLPEDLGILKEVMLLAFENGLGARKSTGKGHFEMVENIQEYNKIEQPQESDYYISLSSFIPAENDPTSGWYKTLIKYGRTDREYATRPNPFKKPVVMLKAGSVFETQKKREFYGTVLEDISQVKGVVQYGYAIPVYMKK